MQGATHFIEVYRLPMHAMNSCMGRCCEIYLLQQALDFNEEEGVQIIALFKIKLKQYTPNATTIHNR